MTRVLPIENGRKGERINGAKMEWEENGSGEKRQKILFNCFPQNCR
jgi:hypothetical protein